MQGTRNKPMPPDARTRNRERFAENLANEDSLCNIDAYVDPVRTTQLAGRPDFKTRWSWSRSWSISLSQTTQEVAT